MIAPHTRIRDEATGRLQASAEILWMFFTLFVWREDLTYQIEITKVEIIDAGVTGETKMPMRGVLVTWRNKGPKPISTVYARISGYTADGTLHNDSRERKCIYASETAADIVPTGGTGSHRKLTDDSTGCTFVDKSWYGASGPIIRAEVVPVEAEENETLDKMFAQ